MTFSLFDGVDDLKEPVVRGSMGDIRIDSSLVVVGASLCSCICRGGG